jgi:hypothetical protein
VGGKMGKNISKTAALKKIWQLRLKLAVWDFKALFKIDWGWVPQQQAVSSSR